MAAHGTLLCIDDDPGCLKVRKLLLENSGYDVCTTTSGREGLEVFNSRHFDAVLVDYQMPGMNGAQVASELRRLKPHVPIIMISAYNALPQKAAGLVNAFVSKAEPTNFLVTKIEQLVAASSRAANDPGWLLAAALGTTALVALALEKIMSRMRAADA